MWKFLLTLLLLCSLPVRAASTYRFIFWHPGEAGTTAQAQPLMDLFAAYLAQKIPGTSWEATYFSSESEGKQFIRSQRVAFGVVSQLMWQRYEETLGLQRMLATRPLPHGRNSERWYLLGVPRCTMPIIKYTYVTEPFQDSDLATLFPNFNPGTITPTGNLLGTLKSFTSQPQCEFAVVSERVWLTLQHAGAWPKTLMVQTTSTPISTPSVVQFPGADSSVATRLTTALRTMSSDPEGREILTELRLAGF